MVVLGCVGTTTARRPAGALLAEQRRADVVALQRRLERFRADDDLPDHVGSGTLAAFYIAVLQGLAIQARDGRPGKICSG